jgi:polyhydroxyalkanoate synthesis regulator phasin
MAARKRGSTQSKLLNRAVKAGRSALRQAQRRLPPDVRKQIDKTVKDGQKTIHAAIKQVETRLDRTARQADLERAMKRLDELTRQVRNMASAAAASATASRTRPASRRAATRKPTIRKAATRKASPRATGGAAAVKASPARRRRPTTRRASASGPSSTTPDSTAGQSNGDAS